MIPIYAAKLDFVICKTDIGAQKTDGSALETYGMVIAGFLVQDSLTKVWFFEETFLLANTSMEVVLEMPFLILSDIDIQFAEKKFTWRSYTTAEALPTTRRVELIDKKEFVAAAMDKDSETFVVHVASIIEIMLIHLAREAQIAALQADKAPTEIPADYSDYINVFSPNLAMELPENTSINEHAIELIDRRQPP